MKDNVKSTESLMSIKEALIAVFRTEPNRVFGVQDVILASRAYYSMSAFQESPDPLHGQSRYAHEVRSILARLKAEGAISHLGRNQYRLSR
jgi:phosphate-selective porin